MEYSLTVIICTYNRQNLIRSCLESLIKIKESILPFDIVVIDDGSDYKLKSDFKNFIIKNNIIYKKNTTNKGLAYSRNHGIKLAKTKYILICDDDDAYIQPNKLKNLYEKVMKNNFDIGIGIPTAQSNFKEGYICNLETLFLKGITPPVSYQIYKKRIISKTNYNEKIKAGVDLDLWINLLDKNPKVLLMKNCDIKSIKHSPNKSLTKNYKKREIDLKLSMNIWENKIVNKLGKEYYFKFKKASKEYEIWFKFLDNLSQYRILTALKFIIKNNLIIIIYRLIRFMLWKLFKIRLNINSHLINFF